MLFSLDAVVVIIPPDSEHMSLVMVSFSLLTRCAQIIGRTMKALKSEANNLSNAAVVTAHELVAEVRRLLWRLKNEIVDLGSIGCFGRIGQRTPPAESLAAAALHVPSILVLPTRHVVATRDPLDDAAAMWAPLRSLGFVLLVPLQRLEGLQGCGSVVLVLLLCRDVLLRLLFVLLPLLILRLMVCLPPLPQPRSPNVAVLYELLAGGAVVVVLVAERAEDVVALRAVAPFLLPIVARSHDMAALAYQEGALLCKQTLEEEVAVLFQLFGDQLFDLLLADLMVAALSGTLGNAITL